MSQARPSSTHDATSHLDAALEKGTLTAEPSHPRPGEKYYSEEPLGLSGVAATLLENANERGVEPRTPRRNRVAARDRDGVSNAVHTALFPTMTAAAAAGLVGRGARVASESDDQETVSSSSPSTPELVSPKEDDDDDESEDEDEHRVDEIGIQGPYDGRGGATYKFGGEVRAHGAAAGVVVVVAGDVAHQGKQGEDQGEVSPLSQPHAPTMTTMTTAMAPELTASRARRDGLGLLCELPSSIDAPSTMVRGQREGSGRTHQVSPTPAPAIEVRGEAQAAAGDVADGARAPPAVDLGATTAHLKPRIEIIQVGLDEEEEAGEAGEQHAPGEPLERTARSPPAKLDGTEHSASTSPLPPPTPASASDHRRAASSRLMSLLGRGPAPGSSEAMRRRSSSSEAGSATEVGVGSHRVMHRAMAMPSLERLATFFAAGGGIAGGSSAAAAMRAVPASRSLPGPAISGEDGLRLGVGTRRASPVSRFSGHQHARSASCPSPLLPSGQFGPIEVMVTPPTPRPAGTHADVVSSMALPASPTRFDQTPLPSHHEQRFGGEAGVDANHADDVGGPTSRGRVRSRSVHEGRDALLAPPPFEMAPGKRRMEQEALSRIASSWSASLPSTTPSPATWNEVAAASLSLPALQCLAASANEALRLQQQQLQQAQWNLLQTMMACSTSTVTAPPPPPSARAGRAKQSAACNASPLDASREVASRAVHMPRHVKAKLSRPTTPQRAGTGTVAHVGSKTTTTTTTTATTTATTVAAAAAADKSTWWRGGRDDQASRSSESAPASAPSSSASSRPSAPGMKSDPDAAAVATPAWRVKRAVPTASTLPPRPNAGIVVVAPDVKARQRPLRSSRSSGDLVARGGVIQSVVARGAHQRPDRIVEGVEAGGSPSTKGSDARASGARKAETLPASMSRSLAGEKLLAALRQRRSSLE